MLQDKTSVRSLLDPRTKMLLVLTIATIMIGGSNLGIFGWAKHLLSAIPFLLFLLEKQWKPAFLYGGAYIAAALAEEFILNRTFGALNFLCMALIMIITRMLPGFIMADYMLKTTTVSSFMAAMERMHMPQGVTISLAVTFRFFPTIGEEHRAIQSAMNVRGVRFGGGKPLQMLEYRIVPLMASCMNISEELSAAALTRGLGSPRKRTNICELHFTWFDWLAVGICVASWGLFFRGLLGG